MDEARESVAVDSVSVLLTLLSDHAEQVVATSPTNSRYAEAVLRNAQQVSELIDGNVGEITGMVSTWFAGFRPIAYAVFGIDMDRADVSAILERYNDYSPTVLPNLLGRIRQTSLDEIMGPLFSLDLRRKYN